MKQRTRTYALWMLLAAGIPLHANAQIYNAGPCYNAGILRNQSDLTNTATAQWLNAGSFFISGNIRNDQDVMAPGTGLTTFMGSSGQTISGTKPYISYDATISDSLGLTLGQVLQVNHTGMFSKGIVYAMMPGIPMIFGTNGVPSGAGDASHVKGVVRTLATSGTFSYPIGNGSVCRRIDATGISGNTQGLDAQYFSGNAGPAAFAPNSGKDATPLISYFTREYWLLKPVASDVTAALTVYYGAPYAPNPAGSATDLRVAHKTNAAWWNEGNTAATGDMTAGSVTSQPLNPAQWNPETTDTSLPAFSGWVPVTLGSVSRATPLPLTLLTFTGSRNQHSDLLRWTTAQEINTDRFELEYSSDAIQYSKISTVAAGGNDNAGNYSCTNSNIYGDAFYRLHIIDKDGSASYSPTVRLTGGDQSDQSGISLDNIYPVPFSDQLQLDITSSQDQHAVIALFDIDGRQVIRCDRQLSKGSHRYQLDEITNNIASGSYVLYIRSGSDVISRKVTRQ